MTCLQQRLYAAHSWALLIVLQGVDAAGKDSAITQVMAGLNPQGCIVHPFKEPTFEELDHDFLWRATKRLPPRGDIGIFNRSHYEEVLAVRVALGFLPSSYFQSASLLPTYDAPRELTLTTVNREFETQERPPELVRDEQGKWYDAQDRGGRAALSQ
jgi:polyphosphate kinase 2 (PPK2 family)